jgi:hypothetical protein
MIRGNHDADRPSDDPIEPKQVSSRGCFGGFMPTRNRGINIDKPLRGLFHSGPGTKKFPRKSSIPNGIVTRLATVVVTTPSPLLQPPSSRCWTWRLASEQPKYPRSSFPHRSREGLKPSRSMAGGGPLTPFIAVPMLEATAEIHSTPRKKTGSHCCKAGSSRHPSRRAQPARARLTPRRLPRAVPPHVAAA